MSKYLGVELLSHRYMFSNVVTNILILKETFISLEQLED